jgi:hypothetical protein
MSDRPHGLTTLTVVVRALSVLGVVFFCVQVLLWLKADWVWFAIGQGMLGTGGGPIVVDGRARLLGALGSLPSVVLALFALWQLWRLLGGFAVGRPFDREAQARLRRFGWAMLVSNLLAPLERAWVGFALTLGNAPGQRNVQLGFSSNDYLAVLLSAVILLIAVVLPEALRRAVRSDVGGLQGL